ncbi:MAG: DEAD/DEAH box helicase family protein [Opitutae bacterium]|nr:DEAD/DEAH box helicase family protein [Opitutae bacterium]
MVLKEYQTRTLQHVQAYLQALAEHRAKSAKLAAIDPDAGYDFTVRAWEKAEVGRPYLPRKNGLKEPLPTFCLKVPTGGGKTLLAAKVIDLFQTHYRKRQTGLVLWIVPTTQIYKQTYVALKDRDHPYRQALDLASAGRTLILEKTSGFSPADVTENLCVLMLMLPSANRETKETLRMFKDSGGFARFFPTDDDAKGHADLLRRVPNLDTFEKESGFFGRQVKTSLGNTLRVLQPLIVLDEGHKAYSTGARATLEGFNPSMIVELSATPPEESNVLVDISGQNLLREGMIKLELHLNNRRSVSWKDTLFAALEHRERLEENAQVHEAQTGVYIRPICLIQVERTGKEQRGAGKIHAEDVREYLISVKGVPPEQVAIKSSEKDELKDVDDDRGLLHRDCSIRYIITKQALQEGWDCSFAYVLAILTNPSSKTALTQLVGRILRQPYAKKTGVPALDESYVFCFQRRGEDLLAEVKKGFAAEGLGDLRDHIREERDGTVAAGETQALKPRPVLAKAAKRLVLPTFMVRDGKEWRPAHYEADILSRVSWDKVDVSPLANLPLLAVKDKDVELRAGLDETALGDAENTAVAMPASKTATLDYAFVAGHVIDVMPNPWRGHDLTKRVFETLLRNHPRELVADNFVFIVEELRKRLETERDRLAEGVFRALLKQDEMRFILVGDDLGLEHGLPNRLPKTITRAPGEKKATRDGGDQFELDLFDFVPADGLNTLEQRVATYLDEQEDLLLFWYRNRSRRDYAVQGWKRGRIYADFIFASKADDSPEEFDRVFVVETKGLHLKKFADTDYKRSVFGICNEHARKKGWSEFVPQMSGSIMSFDVVDEEEWQKRVSVMLSD